MKTFREAVGKQDFTLTAELALDPTSTAEDMLAQATLLTPAVDAIQLSDCPNGRIHMSPTAASGLLLKQGIDPVPLLTCRDRNRIALESELLGMAALGVGSVLLMRGDKLPANLQPPTQPVFDLSGVELVKMASRIGNADDTDEPDLFVGALATVFNPGRRWRPKSLRAKIGAGARFIQTQLCFDMEALRRYMARLVENRLTWQVSIMVAVSPLPSAVSARWLRDNLRGSLMPKATVKRLEQARDPELEGVRICSELLQELAEIPGVSGANLMTPGDPATIAAAIDESGIRRDVSD